MANLLCLTALVSAWGEVAVPPGIAGAVDDAGATDEDVDPVDH